MVFFAALAFAWFTREYIQADRPGGSRHLVTLQ
jgi:hypothetical protein